MTDFPSSPETVDAEALARRVETTPVDGKFGTRLFAMSDAERDLVVRLLRCSGHAQTPADTARLDWLQGRIVDTMYLDDGKIVDVRGNNLREAIDGAMKRWPGSLEDEEGAAALLDTSTVGNSKFSNGLSVEDYWQTRDEMTADPSVSSIVGDSK